MTLRVCNDLLAVGTIDRVGISADSADMTDIFGCTNNADYHDLSLDELSKLFSRREIGRAHV